jgi:hypothetical protein
MQRTDRDFELIVSDITSGRVEVCISDTAPQARIALPDDYYLRLRDVPFSRWLITAGTSFLALSLAFPLFTYATPGAPFTIPVYYGSAIMRAPYFYRLLLHFFHYRPALLTMILIVLSVSIGAIGGFLSIQLWKPLVRPYTRLVFRVIIWWLIAATAFCAVGSAVLFKQSITLYSMIYLAEPNYRNALLSVSPSPTHSFWLMVIALVLCWCSVIMLYREYRATKPIDVSSPPLSLRYNRIGMLGCIALVIWSGALVVLLTGGKTACTQVGGSPPLCSISISSIGVVWDYVPLSSTWIAVNTSILYLLATISLGGIIPAVSAIMRLRIAWHLLGVGIWLLAPTLLTVNIVYFHWIDLEHVSNTVQAANTVLVIALGLIWATFGIVAVQACNIVQSQPSPPAPLPIQGEG